MNHHADLQNKNIRCYSLCNWISFSKLNNCAINVTTSSSCNNCSNSSFSYVGTKISMLKGFEALYYYISQNQYLIFVLENKSEGYKPEAAKILKGSHSISSGSKW